MPMPIRPVNQTDSMFPAAMGDERGMGLFGLQNSPMQLMMKEELERRENKKVVAERKGGIDSRDVELIHRLWMEQEENNPVTATSEARGRVSLQVPNSASSYDVMRLKTNGLAIGSGNLITLTKRGEKLLKDKILSTPSSFWLNRSKDGFDLRAAQRTKQPTSKLVRLSQSASNRPGMQKESQYILFMAAEKAAEPFIDEYIAAEGDEAAQADIMRRGIAELAKIASDPEAMFKNFLQKKQDSVSLPEQEDIRISSLKRAIKTAQVGQQMATPSGYGNVFDPNPARRPQVQSEPIEMKNIPGFWDWYRKELQPGRGKDVDARDQYVRNHASGWMNPFFRPWAAKEYYDKALKYAPNQYPYLPAEAELDSENMYQQLMKDNERRMHQQQDREMWNTIRVQGPQTGWGQTVAAANEAARVALAQEMETDESNNCPDCKGTGQYPGGYRKRTQRCFTCGGTGKVQ